MGEFKKRLQLQRKEFFFWNNEYLSLRDEAEAFIIFAF